MLKKPQSGFKRHVQNNMGLRHEQSSSPTLHTMGVARKYKLGYQKTYTKFYVNTCHTEVIGHDTCTRQTDRLMGSVFTVQSIFT